MRRQNIYFNFWGGEGHFVFFSQLFVILERPINYRLLLYDGPFVYEPFTTRLFFFYNIILCTQRIDIIVNRRNVYVYR